MRAAKVDRNQPEIVAAARKLGAVVLHCHTLKNAFDILVFYEGKIYPVEIKDEAQPPSKRRLTKGEEAFKNSIEAINCQYFIVTSPREMVNLLIRGSVETPFCNGCRKCTEPCTFQNKFNLPL